MRTNTASIADSLMTIFSLLEHRYIELFLNSSSDGVGRSYGGSGGGGGYNSRDDYTSSLPAPRPHHGSS